MKRYVDCRHLPAGEMPQMAPADAAIVTAWQAARLAGKNSLPADTVIVIPDFLNYARLLNTGQAATMLKLSGSMGKAMPPGVAAALSTARTPLAAAGMDFWVIARALLTYDMALIPSAFAGSILLHSYLADLAFALNRRQFVVAFFRACKRVQPGIQTQQLAAALSCLQNWDCPPALFQFLYSPRSGTSPALDAAREHDFYARTSFLPDVANLPVDLQQALIRGVDAEPWWAGCTVSPSAL